MKIRELFAAVGFDIDYDALRKLNGELDAVKSVTNEVFGNFRKISEGVRNVGLGLTAGITLPMGALAVSSSKAYAGLEQINVFYETLIGNADEAKTLMTELLDFEGRTPFTLDQVLQYSQKLLMMKIPLEEITGTLRMVGEAAGGRVQYIGGILEQLHQVKNLGYASMMDIRPLSNQGVPIIEALAKVMNTSKAGVMEAVSNRGITYEILMNAIRNIADEREGLLQKQAETLGGLWSTLMSRWYVFRTEIGKLIAEEFHLAEITEFLSNTLTRLVELFKELPSWIKKVLLFGTLLVALTGPVMALVGQLGILITSIGGLTLAMTLFDISLLPVLTTLGSVLAVAAALAVAIGWIALAVDDLYNWIKGNDSLAGVLFGDFESWRDSILSFFDDIKRKIEAIYKVFTDPFSADTWKNFKYEAVHSFKTAFPEWNPADYDFSGINIGSSTTVRPAGAINNIKNEGHSFNFTVPAGTTEDQARYIEKTVRDSLSEYQNEQLNKLYIGNNG